MKTRYVALLRGINVGGNNKISMKPLKEWFEKEGFLNVETYINSGNVIFESDNGDVTAIADRLEKMIEIKTGLQIGVAVITANDLSNAVKSAPDWWGSSADEKHNAIFVIPPTANAEEIAAKAGSTEYERIYVQKDVIFWSAPLETFSRTKWAKIVGTEIYKSVTIRNANTTRKLAELANREE